MAYPTAVNSQTTDSITQANLGILGVSPAIAMGELYVATSQALATAANNASQAQQQTSIMAQAATNVGTALLNSLAAKFKK
jgi:Killing trait